MAGEFSGAKETAGTVRMAEAAVIAQRDYLVRVWGSVSATETYDPGFVAAKREWQHLGNVLQVKREALAAGH